MAGGFGTRLRPLSINVPKPMVPVGNLPIMDHVVSLLQRHGITDITSLLYFQAEDIKNYFKDGSAFGVRMKYVKPDADYGTAGAVRMAMENPDEPVIIISGDLITDFDLTAAMKWHRAKKSDATILLTHIENPLPYGIVITDPEGRIVRFLEKPSWGEAFSDTINTGIYLLEPAAINLIPFKKNYDFSQNLYPLMLSRKMNLYGRIMDGYWKDIGNVNEYQRVHHDLFIGDLKLDLKAEEIRHDNGIIYKGANVQIEEGVELSGTVILGNDTVVGPSTKLSDCTIGHRTRISGSCDIKNSIIWNDNYIGSETVMENVIVCSHSKLGQNVKLMDNVIVSDNCTIGDSATVRANCKIWPNKTVEEGAIVATSVVWGEKWNRELFTDSKVTGLAQSEITPDMAVRLGAALGATLGMGAEVVTSRDASDISRLLRRGLLSGILSAGVNVSDLETMPIPVVRYQLGKGKYDAGIYVRHNPDDYRQIDIILFDGSGLDMPNSMLKKIERNYFGEYFELAPLDKIGHLEYTRGVLYDYRNDFIKGIDEDLIHNAGFKVVVDHSNGSSSQIFPTLFTQLGVTVTELNANLNPRKFSSTTEENAQAIVQLSTIVSSLKADIGFLLNSAAEKLTVVDENGKPMDNQLLLLIITDLYLQTHRPDKIAVPVGASMGVDEIAQEYGTEVIRVVNDHRGMMEAKMKYGVDFVGGTRGGFIFPGFQLGADAIFTSVKILEMMAQTKQHLSQIRKKHEHYIRETISIPCPWARKGLVMRKIITETDNKKRQLIDGIRIFENNGWVLIAPDRMKASFNILAESRSKKDTSQLIKQYRAYVEDCQDN
jgi:mannose-1-phosphate guanylyltransferase/phosphomannomutase